MTLGIQQIAMCLCVFTSQVLVLETVFVPLKSASVSVEYNQILQSYFGEQVGVLYILINKHTKRMCSCYEKMRPWENRRVSLEWENTHTHQISADNHTKEDVYKEELLILQYNLDDKVQKQYQDICQEGDNTLCWNYHTEYKYDLDPPDTGAGNHTRFWFRVYLDD